MLGCKGLRKTGAECLSSPFTPQHQYAYSPYCFWYIYSNADQENLLTNQENI